MEQKDFILREIEKIGKLLKMIFNLARNISSNESQSVENQLSEAKETLVQEAGFDIDLFVSFNDSEIALYISKFPGLNGSNIESLADALYEVGLKSEPDTNKEYLNKALKLYEMCNASDKTYSFDREGKISNIKNTLYNSKKQES